MKSTKGNEGTPIDITDNEIDFAKSGSHKLRINEIKIMIEKIVINYIHFWNISINILFCVFYI